MLLFFELLAILYLSSVGFNTVPVSIIVFLLLITFSAQTFCVVRSLACVLTSSAHSNSGAAVVAVCAKISCKKSTSSFAFDTLFGSFLSFNNFCQGLTFVNRSFVSLKVTEDFRRRLSKFFLPLLTLLIDKWSL